MDSESIPRRRILIDFEIIDAHNHMAKSMAEKINRKVSGESITPANTIIKEGICRQESMKAGKYHR